MVSQLVGPKAGFARQVRDQSCAATSTSSAAPGTELTSGLYSELMWLATSGPAG
jgi:hypothetical protein